MRRWLALLGWLGFVGVAIGALHRVGPSFPVDSIGDPGGPLEPALAAAVRLAGLGVGYWLAGSTVFYFIGLAAGLPGAIRAIRWATIAPLRRLIDGVVTGALVASMGVPASAASSLAPGYVPLPAGDRPADATLTGIDNPPDIPVEEDPAVPTPSLPPNPVPSVIGPPFTAHPLNGAEIQVVVRSGDHLWGLAERRLIEVQGRGVSDSEVALYWLTVIAANLPRIRSADPDLIYPGEVLVLPAIEG